MISINFSSVLPRDFGWLRFWNLTEVIDIFFFVNEFEVFTRIQVGKFPLFRDRWRDWFMVDLSGYWLFLDVLSLPHLNHECRRLIHSWRLVVIWSLRQFGLRLVLTDRPFIGYFILFRSVFLLLHISPVHVLHCLVNFPLLVKLHLDEKWCVMSR